MLHSIAGIVLAVGLTAVPPTVPPGSSVDGDSTTPPPVTRYPLARPTVTMIEAGEEPRETMRLAFTVGDEFRRRIRVEQSFQEYENGAVRTPERPIPFFLELNGSVTSFEDRAAVLRLEIEGAGLIPVRRARPAEEAHVKEVADAITGLVFTVRVDDRGVVHWIEHPDPIVLDPPARTWVPRLARVIGGAWIPLPEEAIGRKASWSIEGVQRLDLLSLAGTSTCTLTRIANADLTIELDGKYEAIGQRVPAAPLDGPLAGARDLVLVNGVYRWGARVTVDRKAPFRFNGKVNWMAQLLFTAVRGDERIDYRPLTLLRIDYKRSETDAADSSGAVPAEESAPAR